MSLGRKDARFKLNHDSHAVLKILSRAAHKKEGEFLEEIIEPILWQRLSDANLISAEATVAGISGIHREKPGRSGAGKDRSGGDRS